MLKQKIGLKLVNQHSQYPYIRSLNKKMKMLKAF